MNVVLTPFEASRTSSRNEVISSEIIYNKLDYVHKKPITTQNTPIFSLVLSFAMKVDT